MIVKDTVGESDIYQYEDDENEEESREIEMKLMGDIDSMSRTTERDSKQGDKEVKQDYCFTSLSSCLPKKGILGQTKSSSC